MNICIYRGSNQIGGSCVEIEQDGQRIILDVGLPLDAETNDKALLPAIEGLDGSDPDLLGIFLSHTHLDHTGLLKHISPEIKVGLGPAARRIIKAALPFLPDKFPTVPEGWEYQSWKSFQVGPFKITPYLVDRSAYDAYALLIEAGNKRLFYSGDFRGHGRKAKLFQNILTKPPINIDVLLMEGSTLGRIDQGLSFPSETDIENELVNAFTSTKGLAMVHASGQNVDRVVSIMRASKRTNRILLIDLYTAVILEATQNSSIPQSHWPEMALLVPHYQRVKILKNAWFDTLKRHSSNRVFLEKVKQNPEKYTLLFRPLFISDLNRGECL
ncbi:MAG: MBL fold metallo-hydrolase, partial [Desulfonatronovibrio sp.]